MSLRLFWTITTLCYLIEPPPYLCHDLHQQHHIHGHIPLEKIMNCRLYFYVFSKKPIYALQEHLL